MIAWNCFAVVIVSSALIAISAGIEIVQPLAEQRVSLPLYQVSLEHNRLPICSGTIIRENWIITAANCVTGPDNTVIKAFQLRVRAGSNFLTPDGFIAEVRRVIVHEKFKFPNSGLALLELMGPLPLSTAIETIKIRKGDVPPGFSVNVYGWGLRDSTIRSENLLKSTQRVLSKEECCRRYGIDYNHVICLDHLIGPGACAGDSGGPAVNKKFIPKKCDRVFYTSFDRQLIGLWSM